MQSVEQRSPGINQILIKIEYIVGKQIGKQQQTDYDIRRREQQLHPSALFQNMPGIRNRAKIKLKQGRRQITAQEISIVQYVAKTGIRILCQKPDVVCF